MKIYSNIEKIGAQKKIVLTIGSFDGLHIGHRSVIKQLKEAAKREGAQSMIVTLSPHPRVVTGSGKEVALIYSEKERLYLLEELGVDYLYCINFNSEISRLSGHEFITKYLTSNFRLKALLMGYNNFIGSDRASIEELTGIADKLGFTIETLSEASVEGDHISSSIIRELLERGDVTRAASYLGGNYFILSSIEKGSLTADMGGRVRMEDGRYSVIVTAEGKTLECSADISGGRIKIDKSLSYSEVRIEFIDKY